MVDKGAPAIDNDMIESLITQSMDMMEKAYSPYR